MRAGSGQIGVRWLWVIGTLVGSASGSGAPGPDPDPDFDAIRGVDASQIAQVEENGGTYHDAGAPADPFTILRGRGVNFVRLRVWNDPPDGHCGVDELLEIAARAHDAGMGLLVDFHYSDSWADPSQQTKPAAWDGLDAQQLRDAVRSFTAQTIASLVSQGNPPNMVQVGNEVSNGFLWPDGRLDASPGGNWPAFASLLDAAIAGVRDAEPADRPIEIVVHYDDGGDNAGARWFFDHLDAQGVAFDTIGLSFYPWWHGSLADLEASMGDLATRYSRRVLVLETAYPWTLAWADSVANAIGLPAQLLPGYPATPAGQASLFGEVLDAATRAQDGHRSGVFYWGGDWITAPNLGSAWENLALFDFTGAALPVLDAFARPHVLDQNADGRLDVEDLYHVHTNPTDTDLDGDADPGDAAFLERAVRRLELPGTLAGSR